VILKVVLFCVALECGSADMRMMCPNHGADRHSSDHLALMKYYAHFGHKDFILCRGYRGNAIRIISPLRRIRFQRFCLVQRWQENRLPHRIIDDWTITFVERASTPTSASA